MKIFIYFIFILFLYSCGTIKEGFTNQKKNNSDEFLVEKKSPLVMPPDYNELPTPQPFNGKSVINNTKIIDLIKKEDNKNIGESTSSKIDQDFEKVLIEKLNKN